MTLETKHVYRAHLQEPGIGRTVRRVAAGAALGFHRYVLVDERPLLVGMAFETHRVPARQGFYLPERCGSVNVMAVVALHQTLVDAVMIGFRKVRLRSGMASVAQLRLALDEKVLCFLGVMRRMAIKAAHIATGMGGF